MKNFLISSVIVLALVTGVTSNASTVHAEVGVNGSACELVPGSGKPDGVLQNNTCVAMSAYVSQSNTGTSAAANTPTSYENTTVDTLFNPVMNAVAGLFAWLVGVSALALDYSVYYTVINMGAYVHNLTAIGVTWRILRDIGNIIFIFGFLSIGISIILNGDWYASGKKMLPMLLVGAIFLNFSLFFAEAIIDTGNLFATQFYQQINGGSLPKVSTGGAIVGSDSSAMINGKEGISNKLMAQLGLQEMYNDAIDKKEVLQKDHPFYIGFMAAILFLITAFVMFSLAFILIARFVTLLFLIILAPIGFAGLAVPQLAGQAKKWWTMLFNQTITAPILLLLLYIALAIITDAQFLTGLGGGTSGAMTGYINNSNLPGFASYVLSFLIAIGLMLAVTIAAKSLGAVGAAKATAFASKLTLGATAYGMRYTAGYASNKLAQKVRENKSLNSTGVGRLVGRKVAGAFDYGATASYHVGAGLAAGGVGVDFGKTHQGGYRAEEKVSKEYKTSVETAQKEKIKADRIKEIDDAKGKLDNHEITQDEYNDTVTQNMAKLSTKELEDLDGIKKGTEDLVKNLSPQQFEALMKSDNLSAAQKGGLRDARFKEVNTKIAAAMAPGATQTQKDTAQAAIAKMSTKELSHMDKNVLTGDFVADHMTNDQYDSLTKEGVLNAAQKTAIDVRRKNRFDSTVTPPADVASAIKSMKWNRDQIKKLPPATLTDVNVLNALGADALNLIDIARTGNLSPTDRKKLGAYFEDIAMHPTDPRQADFAAYLAADPRIKRDLLIT